MYDTELSSTYSDYIERAAKRALESFIGTIDEKGEYLSPIYAGAASMGEAIAADYHGRFLIELIQNANDVHPDSQSDGEIEILFDRRGGGDGVLYVANRGAPFSAKNVDALRNMGLSSKPPGESIGNKGLGFRSVGHICDSPAIYSQADNRPGAAGFEGFCFRFAQAEDLQHLLGDERHRELAQRDLPLFHVPVWLTEQPETVRAFARLGFATVIALPVRSVAAAQDVMNEIAELQAQKAPVLLFLSRLERLTVRLVDENGVESRALSLERHERRLGELSVADLGAAGRYVIARSRIADATMTACVQDGVEKKQLHKHWLKWEGDGEVALAVRLDGAVATPRLYTFLPMGQEAVAPFSGYLHGSFFPSSNRKNLDASVHLNAVLLKAAAHLAADTVARLVDPNTDFALDLEPEERARMVVDFMCWRKVDSLQTAEDLPAEIGRRIAAGLGAANLGQASVIPVLTFADEVEGVGWGRPIAARQWSNKSRTFGVQIAAAFAQTTGAFPIWPGLDDRAPILAAYLIKHVAGYSQAPSAMERGALAVQVAQDIAAAKRPSTARWSAYYKDLVELLDKVGHVLAGKPVLLCADGKLRAAMVAAPEVQATAKRRRRAPIAVAVFSPPARRGAEKADAEQLSPPQSLVDNFAFLSDLLDWHGELSEARGFLEKQGLVLEFDRETILTQLSRVVRADPRAVTRAAGLRWAFQIWRRPQETGRGFQLQPAHRFLVPTADGEFIEASEAIFSETWPEEMSGRLLQRFLNAAPPTSADVVALGRRRLAPKTHYTLKVGGNTELWTRFLTQLGVKRGLHPTKQEVAAKILGWRLRDMVFCNALGISSQAAQTWKADILAENAHAMAMNPSSDYYIRGEILWMPGQGDVAEFSRECLEYYAQLVIGWLGEAQPTYWDLSVHHYHFIHDDARTWPTPLKSFLRSAAWIPADEPSASGGRRVSARPSDIWMALEAGDRFPSFLRRPAVPVMRALERAGPNQIQILQTRGGLHLFDDPNGLVDQAVFLAEQYAKEGFDRYFERRLLNLYFATWRKIAERFGRGQLGTQTHPPHVLLARRGADTAVVRPALIAHGDEPFYVRDGDDETAVSLLEAAGRLLFDARTDHVGVGKVMRAFYGEKVRLLSQVNYAMSVDGREVGEGEIAPILARWPRLKGMVAVAMEALKGPEAQRLPADRHVIIDRLERVLFQGAATIGFKIDGLDVDQEVDGRSAFALKLADGRAIVVCRTTGPTTWSVLDEALGALCEAIDQPVLESVLRILLLGQRSVGAAPTEVSFTDLDLEDMCATLRLSRSARRAVRETLGAGLERHLPWLRALLYVAGGRKALDTFAVREAEVVKDIADLRRAISPWLGPLQRDADQVLEACKTALTIAELRDALGLDFEALNLGLIAVGEKPDTYAELHAGLLVGYAGAHDLEITDLLRAAYAPTLGEGSLAPQYAQAREASRALSPDPDWLLKYKEVPDALIGAHIDLWLHTHGAGPLGSDPSGLETLDRVRRANAAALRVFVETAGPLVRAWSKTRATPHQIWREVDGGLVGLRALLDQSGAFDWRTFNSEELLAWTDRVGVWPQGMDLTLDRTVHKIVERDIVAEQAQANAAAEARRKAARSIPFNGRAVDPEGVDWTALEAELVQSLSQKLFATPLGRKAGLAPARGKGGGSNASASGSGGGGGANDVPSQMTDMIGRLGELAVRHWLMRNTSDQDIDAAWKSKIGEQFTGRPGNDGLGYDFAVNVGRQLWQIEVKASLNDPLAFKMGETEVRAGRAAARARSGVQYWIAYVSNLSVPALAKVEMIPNPMSEQGEAVLDLLGQGLRYGFHRV